jgi:hypothetical protein
MTVCSRAPTVHEIRTSTYRHAARPPAGLHPDGNLRFGVVGEPKRPRPAIARRSHGPRETYNARLLCVLIKVGPRAQHGGRREPYAGDTPALETGSVSQPCPNGQTVIPPPGYACPPAAPVPAHAGPGAQLGGCRTPWCPATATRSDPNPAQAPRPPVVGGASPTLGLIRSHQGGPRRGGGSGGRGPLQQRTVHSRQRPRTGDVPVVRLRTGFDCVTAGRGR